MPRSTMSVPSVAGDPTEWITQMVPNARNLVPYVPGKPIEETKREFGLSEVIKLASNENPLGPSPLALEAVSRQLLEAHLYPDASHYDLKQALSHHLKISPEWLSIGNGSDELIDLLVRTFVPAGKNMVSPRYSFLAYRRCARLQGCGFHEVPVDDEFCCTADDILKTVNADTRVVILANPGNPTGSWMDADEIFKLAQSLNEKHILLILDYAYWEYVTTPDIPSPEALLNRFGNVVILRTFSKLYGLAGFRVGYMMSHPSIVSIIDRSRPPFNVSSLALTAATAALSDDAFVRKTKRLNEEGKAALVEGLSRYPIRVFNGKQTGQGNFVLIDLGKPAQPVFQEFLKRGVIVRPLLNYGLANHLRITAGTAEEIEIFFKALASIWKDSRELFSHLS